MGLIKAIVGAAGSVLSDQWKEYFYCDSLSENVLAVQGKKKVSSHSSNRNASDNIITSGSLISVADGQCMLIVEQGKIVDICAQSGEYTYDASTEPSVFSGDLGDGILEVFKSIGKRFTFGGTTAKDQRVYYINTKELIGNKYGTPSPVPFRVVDRNIGLDIDVSVSCFGEYSFRIANPLLFYTNVCSNFDGEYTRDRLAGQMKTELLTALQPAFSKISDMGIRYSSLPGHTMEMADALNEVLSTKWLDIRGIEIVSFGVSSVKASAEDEAMIKEAQRNAMFRDPTMGAAHMVGAQADAMKAAAENANGAAMGFMGLNMAASTGGMNAQNLYQMGAIQQQQASQTQQSADSWSCPVCGAKVSGKFCPECGAKKPETAGGWICSCGTVNKGKFCSECGQKKPKSVPQYKCDKCGWEPEDPAHPPKFCPECGDPFDNGDIVG